MLHRRQALLGFLALVLGLLALCPRALALAPAAGTQPGRPVALAASATAKKHGSSSCENEIPVVGGILGGVCEVAGEAVGAVGGLVGEAAGAVGNGILELVAKWIIGAATAMTSFIAHLMQQTSTPQLQSSWFEAQFAPMADLGAALGLLVALVAFASAAIRRSPQALAGAITGIARAGLGTGLVVALTVIGLGIAEEISGAVLGGSPHSFWSTASSAWSGSGFGGFGSSALAMLIALVEVFAAIFVWLELIVRDAAIYLAVLFFPVALAASIWPALSAWPGRLGRLLLLFVILKPVALIVLSFAGNAAAAGLSFGSGVPSSVGTILAATVIFGLAAFTPWALMFLLAADAESAFVAMGVRSAAVSAVGDKDGRSVRSAGGLRKIGGAASGGASGGSSSGGGGSSSGGGGGGSSSGGGGSPGGGGGGSPQSGGPSANGNGAGAGSNGAGARPQSDTLPVAAESIGAGSIGAAAGMSARSGSAVSGDSQEQGSGSHVQGTSARSGPPAASRPPRATPSSAARATSAGAPSERPSGGSARKGAPGADEQPAQAPSGGQKARDGAATPTLAGSPQRHAASRSPRPAASTTSTGASSERPSGGSARKGAPGDHEQPARAPSDGQTARDGDATPTVLRPPQREAASRSPAPVAGSSSTDASSPRPSGSTGQATASGIDEPPAAPASAEHQPPSGDEAPTLTSSPRRPSPSLRPVLAGGSPRPRPPRPPSEDEEA